MFEDFTLVIQGPVHRNINTMALLHPNVNTIISTWDDPTWTHPTVREYLEPLRRENLQIIVSKLPKKEKMDKMFNKQNRYYQFLSTFKGLQWVQTKYAIKVRSDEYYSNLEPLMMTFLQDTDKLVTNDVFFRRSEYLRYHPSDHIICGQTEKMRRLFELLMYDCQFNHDMLKFAPFDQHDFFLFVEQQIGMKYIEMNEKVEQYPYKIPKEFEEVKRLMVKYFDIVNNSMLGDFYAVANSEGKTYINSYDYYDPAKDIQMSLEEL